MKQRADPRKNITKSSIDVKKEKEAEKPAQEKDTYKYYQVRGTIYLR